MWRGSDPLLAVVGSITPQPNSNRPPDPRHVEHTRVSPKPPDRPRGGDALRVRSAGRGGRRGAPPLCALRPARTLPTFCCPDHPPTPTLNPAHPPSVYPPDEICAALVSFLFFGPSENITPGAEGATKACRPRLAPCSQPDCAALIASAAPGPRFDTSPLCSHPPGPQMTTWQSGARCAGGLVGFCGSKGAACIGQKGVTRPTAAGRRRPTPPCPAPLLPRRAVAVGRRVAEPRALGAALPRPPAALLAV
jgi:hypothetical protein